MRRGWRRGGRVCSGFGRCGGWGIRWLRWTRWCIRPANALLHGLAFRAAWGPHADRLNRELMELAEREKPDLFWADKVLLLEPATLRRMRAQGIATVSYMIDNAFGPRRDPGWRRYMRCIPEFDLHVTQRLSSVEEYRRRGARDAMTVLLGYEPTVHFPPRGSGAMRSGIGRSRSSGCRMTTVRGR